MAKTTTTTTTRTTETTNLKMFSAGLLLAVVGVYSGYQESALVGHATALFGSTASTTSIAAVLGVSMVFAGLIMMTRSIKKR
tara:strand:- start:368 stop:613 length:246 start_codon:yes stop_codon:yes gene_type:complete